MPVGSTTLTVPLVARAGTEVAISVFEITLKAAGVPLKLTWLAPVNPVPNILINAPGLPPPLCVSTNGPRPTERP